MDDTELIERYEDKLSQFIQDMRKDGIAPETIAFILQETIKNLNLMAYCQAWLSQCSDRKPASASETLSA